METDYWKTTEVRNSFKEWKDFYNGCLHCACDHGCNQWVAEQKYRVALFFRIMETPNASTSLDKVAKIPLKRILKIYWYLTHEREFRRWRNRSDDEPIKEG